MQSCKCLLGQFDTSCRRLRYSHCGHTAEHLSWQPIFTKPCDDLGIYSVIDDRRRYISFYFLFVSVRHVSEISLFCPCLFYGSPFTGALPCAKAHAHQLGRLPEGGFYLSHNEKTKRMRMVRAVRDIYRGALAVGRSSCRCPLHRSLKLSH